jgi:hypothetical protein
MTAPTFDDSIEKTYLVTSSQLRRVEVTANRLFAERRLVGDGMRDLAQYLAVGYEDALEVDVRAEMKKAHALDAIHRLLDGVEAGSSQIADICELLTKAGYEIKDPFHAGPPDPLDTFTCSGCMTEYGADQLHRTCGECAADFCHPCWTNHYDKHDDQLACMPGLSAEALGADAEPHDNNCPGTVKGEMCHHPSHKQEQ